MSAGGSYEVSSEDPDPRGWTVITHDGTRIGEVTDLVVDQDALKVRYFEVELDREGGADNRVLMDVNDAELAESDRSVIVAAGRVEGDWQRSSGMLGAASSGAFGTASSGTLETASSGTLGTESAHGAYGNAVHADSTEATRMTRAEEELRIGTREQEAGEVVLRKTVEQEHVSQPVERRVERVRVERRPVQHAGTTEARIEGAEIRVPIVEEELVVEKRAVVKEEIVVTREVDTETEVVEADIRKERVDVEGDRDLLQTDRGTVRGDRRG